MKWMLLTLLMSKHYYQIESAGMIGRRFLPFGGVLLTLQMLQQLAQAASPSALAVARPFGNLFKPSLKVRRVLKRLAHQFEAVNVRNPCDVA